MRWPFDHSYARELTGLFAEVSPTPVADPRLLALNEPLAVELGLDPDELGSDDGVSVLAGNVVPAQARPIAQAYAGHQFGQFAGVLGDGRAVLLGEVIDTRGNRRDVALKGSGRTPFSRGGDGRAAIGPVLREYLVSEAMHSLGVPTTRSLAAVSTGEVVRRQPPEPGAVLTRIAASHLRVGTFELVRSTGDVDAVRALSAYARARHFPHIAEDDPIALLTAIADRQAALVAQWMSVGFIHGVMNTDNMAISGETIDYGPCAFLERYDPNAVFSSIDQQGRYRFDAQPSIAAWNLARLAECLIAPLGEEAGPSAVEQAVAVLDGFVNTARAHQLTVMDRKLGLDTAAQDDPGLDAGLAMDLLDLMANDRLDFTLTFRRLAQVLRGEPGAAREQALDLRAWDSWQNRWLARIGERSHLETAAAMDAVNPIYIPRNHLVEEALAAARAGDLVPFESMLEVVRGPFVERAGWERYAEPAPSGFTEEFQTFCGT